MMSMVGAEVECVMYKRSVVTVMCYSFHVFWVTNIRRFSLYEAFAQCFLIHVLTEVVGSCLYMLMYNHKSGRYVKRQSPAVT